MLKQWVNYSFRLGRRKLAVLPLLLLLIIAVVAYMALLRARISRATLIATFATRGFRHAKA